MQESTLLAEIELKGIHRVFRVGSSFEVEAVDRHGVRRIQVVGAAPVEWLARRLAGSTVTVGEALAIVEPIAERMALPYTYGHKLRFFTQDMLLVLVATDRAGVDRRGRGFEYHVY